MQLLSRLQLSGHFCYLLPALLFYPACAVGSFQFDIRCFFTDFEIICQPPAVQLAVKDRSLDAAAWLVLMTTIPESTSFRQRFDVFESAIETIIDRPDLKFPHSRRIHDQAAGGE